jgi:collagenase-like PrtC family protease
VIAARAAPEILAPVRAADEVDALVDAGASRLYCGVAPRAWTERYSRAVWLSRRSPGAAVDDLAALGHVVDRAARRGVAVELALNAPSFTAEQIDRALELARGAIGSLGVSAAIVAEPSLMLALGEEGLPFVASTVAVGDNAEALGLFRALGAQSAVLPRHLRADEIAELAGQLAGFPLEVIALYDGCAFEEGNCHTLHGLPGATAFCQIPWQLEVQALDRALSPADADLWRQATDEYRAWLAWSDACSAPVDSGGAPNGTCALCALPALAAAGVAAFKIAGRQAPLLRRLRGIEMTRRVLCGEVEHPPHLRPDSEGCASRRMCATAAVRF